MADEDDDREAETIDDEVVEENRKLHDPREIDDNEVTQDEVAKEASHQMKKEVADETIPNLVSDQVSDLAQSRDLTLKNLEESLKADEIDQVVGGVEEDRLQHISVASGK